MVAPLTKDGIPSIVTIVIEALPNMSSSTVTHSNSTTGQTLATVTTPDAAPQDQGTMTNSEQLQQELGEFDTYCVSRTLEYLWFPHPLNTHRTLVISY